jgi:hypothetical protein
VKAGVSCALHSCSRTAGATFLAVTPPPPAAARRIPAGAAGTAGATTSPHSGRVISTRPTHSRPTFSSTRTGIRSGCHWQSRVRRVSASSRTHRLSTLRSSEGSKAGGSLPSTPTRRRTLITDKEEKQHYRPSPRVPPPRVPRPPAFQAHPPDAGSPLEPQAQHHSMSSSARIRSDCGTVSPRALAVFRLMTRSKWVA